MKNNKKKVIAIVGPTACGKTGLAVFLAKKFSAIGGPASGWNGCEIVSADSRQVYRTLDIGTGKDLEEYGNIKYHLIDILEPEANFTLFNWLELARSVIDDIFNRGKLPIVVGGTGLYVQALTQGFELEKIQNDECHPELVSGSQYDNKGSRNKTCAELDSVFGMTKYQREELDRMSLAQLQSIVEPITNKLKPKSYNLDLNNPRRLIRFIERAQSGEQMTKFKPNFSVLQIGIDLPREVLYSKIDQRVDERFFAGMVDEVKGLLKQGVDPQWLIKLGLEYRIITEYMINTKELKNLWTKELKKHCHREESRPLDDSGQAPKSDVCVIPTPTGALRAEAGIHNRLPRFANPALAMTEKENFESMKQDLKFKIHAYARRQLTWFRRFPEIEWINSKEEALEFAKKFVV